MPINKGPSQVSQVSQDATWDSGSLYRPKSQVPAKPLGWDGTRDRGRQSGFQRNHTMRLVAVLSLVAIVTSCLSLILR